MSQHPQALMRGSIVLLAALACTSATEPGGPRVVIRQVRAPSAAPMARATVTAGVLTVMGHYGLRHGCRRLSGHLDHGATYLKLTIQGSAPRVPCVEPWAAYDYEARVTQLPVGQYQLTVIHTGAEQGRRPIPIVLRTDLRVE
jgi:hypothetical protein